MNHDRVVASVARGEEYKLVRTVLQRKCTLLVTWLQALSRRLDPDLQKMYGVGVGSILLAVQNAGPGGHSLKFAASNDRSGSHAVLVAQRALEHVRQNLHVAVGVGSESPAGSDAIFIDHPQRPKTHIPGI